MTDLFLVTGSLGCVGGWVVRRLAEAGVPTRALDAGTDRARLDLILEGTPTSATEFVQADISDLDAVCAAMEGVTHVIHLAALQVPFCRADPSLGARVNVVGTVNVFEAAARAGGVPVVYAGSVGMFDVADAEPTTMQVAEDAMAHPRTHYGVYKQANEGSASVYWEEAGVPSVGLRPFVIYGPGRDQGLTSSPTFAMLAAAVGRPYTIKFGGRFQLQLARDAADSFIKAVRWCREGASTFNLGGPVSSVEEIVAAVAAVAPEAASGIRLSDERLPFPESVDASAVERAMGPMPSTSLDTGVRETVEHFRRAADEGLVPQAVLEALDR